MPSYVFPKHHALNFNAKVNARSTIKKSTIYLVWLGSGILFGRHNIFTGFGKFSSSGPLSRVQLGLALARHINVF